jgi:pilus assembly protein CpaC
MPKALIWSALLGLLVGGGPLAGARAQGGAQMVRRDSIVLPVNSTKILQMKNKEQIATARVQKPEVATLSFVEKEKNQVMITGMAPGTTIVTLTSVDNKEETFTVDVVLDVEYLKRILVQAAPTANIAPIAISNNTIILTGWVANAEDIEIIMKAAQSIVGPGVVNAMRLSGVQQVQLDVMVARVSRSHLRNMQFDFINVGNHHILSSSIGGMLALPSGSITGTLPGAPAILNNISTPPNVFLGVFNSSQGFFGLLQALRTENLVKLSSEPSLTTISGRTALFRSGGRQAVPTVAGLGGTAGVEFVPFGTEVTMLPIVLGNGRIRLEVEPSVEALDNASGIQIPGGGFVAGRTEQRVRTVVEMAPGQTVAIGGLLQNTVQGTTSRIPFIGDLPFVGAAFSRKNYMAEEEELLFLVTPHLVDAMDSAQVPKSLPGMETRNPDDFELFLEGILEAPHGCRKPFENGHYVPAFKGPNALQYPCGASNGSSCGGRCEGCVTPRTTLETPARFTNSPAALPATAPVNNVEALPVKRTSSEEPGAPVIGPGVTSGEK